MYASSVAVACCLFLSTIQLQVAAKVYTHCELAQELRRLQIPESQIATWVCIAHYESRLNTSAISGTGDHGIFQISEEYWCSPPGRGKGCGLTCAELEDDHITDDVECVQTIFDEHQGLSGNGFNAWAVYPRCKKSSNANRFIKKCSAGVIDNSIESADTPIDRRFDAPTSHVGPVYSAPQSSHFSKPSYLSRQDYNFKPSYSPSQDYSFSKTAASPFGQDYSVKPSYSPSQDFSFIKTSASPFSHDYSVRSSYNPSQDISFTKTSASPFSQDYSFKSIYSPSQDVTFAKASVSPFIQGYDYSGRYEPFSYTTGRPTQVFSSSTAPPSPAILAYSPSLYSSSRPSSYSIGSIYYNPFGTKSTTAGPVVYSFNPTKSFSTSTFDGSRNLFGFHSTPAPQVYKVYTESDGAVIKTSSPAPPLKFKAPWADFPWWNGGK